MRCEQQEARQGRVQMNVGYQGEVECEARTDFHTWNFLGLQEKKRCRRPQTVNAMRFVERPAGPESHGEDRRGQEEKR